MRYFYSELASRPLTDGATTITFEKTAIVGSNICGIYAADSPAEVGLLEQAAHQRTGVIEISEEDYNAHKAQKKSTPSWQQSSTLRPVQQVQPQQLSTMAETQGVTSAEKTDKQQSSNPESGRIDNPKSIVKLDKVNSPAFVNDSERLAPVEAKSKASKRKV